MENVDEEMRALYAGERDGMSYGAGEVIEFLESTKKGWSRVLDIAGDVAERERQVLEKEAVVLERLHANIRNSTAERLGVVDLKSADLLLATADLDCLAEDAGQQFEMRIRTLLVEKPYLQKTYGFKLEPFNPGSANGTPETDEQVVQRLHQRDGGHGPLG